MKSRYLFPHCLKPIGWIIFIPCFIFGIIGIPEDSVINNFFDRKVFALFADGFFTQKEYMGIIKNNIFDEILAIGIIIGGFFIAFSKMKDEDEFISKIRLDSLLWATYANYGILLLAIIFIYDMDFLQVMIYNMFTILIFFIIRFHWAVYKSKKTVRHEK